MLTGLGSMDNELERPELQKSQDSQDESKQQDNQARNLRKLGLFAIVIGDLLAYTGAGVAVGYLAWVKWNAPWWILLITTPAGLCLAFYQLYRVSQKEL